MTKEEQLKEEAENKLDEWSDPDMGCCEGYCYSEVADFMFRFAEPREKRIAELDCQKNRNKFCYSCANATERCFTNEIGCPCEKYKSYKEENAELEEQIEKMRNFQNCDYQLHVTDCPIFKSGGHISCKKCPYWILQDVKEND